MCFIVIFLKNPASTLENATVVAKLMLEVKISRKADIDPYP